MTAARTALTHRQVVPLGRGRVGAIGVDAQHRVTLAVVNPDRSSYRVTVGVGDVFEVGDERWQVAAVEESVTHRYVVHLVRWEPTGDGSPVVSPR